jgi:hypothetical protein
MLIWKVIAANPGITRAQIWERVEHGIPLGYALRVLRHENDRPGSPRRSFEEYARSRMLTRTLASMKYQGMIAKDGDGFRALREPWYVGNAEAVDETGTKAAEHMAVAEALRRVERLLATPSAVQKYGRKNCEAMALLVKTLRAKGGAAG